MSVLDALLVFSDEQAITATADSENTIDLGAGYDAFGAARANPELADGKPLWLNVVVDTVLDSAGEAATLAVSLKTDADNLSTFTTVYTTAAIAEATLAAGYVVLAMPLPLGLLRYNKLTYTVAVEDFTSGTLNAWIGLEPARAR